MFNGCENLTNVIIPNSVTSIGYGAFRGCIGLTSVTIGSGVTSIYGGAFENCTALEEIHFEGTVSQCNAISKYDNWNLNTGSYTIYCTDGNIVK